MINLIKFRRSGLWLLSFIAALLVLSPSAGAYDAASIQGYYNNVSPTESLGEWVYTSMNKIDNDNYTFDLTPTKAGTFYIKFKLNDNEFTYSNGAGLPTSEPSSNNAKYSSNGAGEFNYTVSAANINKKHTIKVKCSSSDWQNAKIWVSVSGGVFSIIGYNDSGNVTYTFTGSSNTRTVVVDNYENAQWGFKVDDGSTQYGNSGSGNYTLTNTVPFTLTENGNVGGNLMLPEAAKGKKVTFTLTLTNNKPSKLTATWSTIPTSLCFRSDRFGGINTSTPIVMGKSADGKVYSYKFSYTAGTEVNFNFRQRQSGWGGYRLYPSANNTTVEAGKTYSIGGYDQSNQNPDKTWKFVSQSGDPVTVTVDFTDSNNPKLTLTQAPDDPTHPEYFLHAGFIGNWDSNGRMLFTPAEESNDKVLVLKTTYKESNDGNYGFKITTKKPADNGKWYSVGSALVNGTSYDLTDAKPNTTLHESALGKEVTFTLTLNDDYTPKSLVCTWTGNDPIAVGSQMPVYPIGVNSTSAFKRYDKWPVIYLQSRVLNSNRITPEYQMTKINDNRYELEFTMRNTKAQDNAWDSPEDGIRAVGFNDANSDDYVVASIASFSFPSAKKFPNEGARYKAICSRDDSGWKLELEPVGDINTIPFLSMIGSDWRQSTQAVTPTVPRKNNSSNTHLNTGSGWQEAWVQYDELGKVRKDRKGNVMYNTIWPPRNTINFSTNFNGRDFTLTSKDLTFVAVGTKKGSEWKEEFSNYPSANLSTEYASINGANDIKGKLALDDETVYTLYRVEDMWINGDVKLWSGWYGTWSWNGNNSDSELANWNSHYNLGQYKEKWDEAVTINPESSVPMGTHDGDMKFSQPTYFKYVDFFYDTTSPNVVGKNVLFTELSKGGAQIAAMSSKDPNNNSGVDRTDYEVGNYQSALAYLQTLNNDNAVLKSVDIRSYISTGTDEEGEMVKPVFFWEASGDNSKKNIEFHTLFNAENGNDELNGGFNGEYVNTADKCASTAKWVVDPNEYPNGNYFYRMKVVLTDNNGKEYTEIVDSNPFTIFRQNEKLTVDVYQLVKVEETAAGDGTYTNRYYTYKGSKADPSVPELPAFEVIIENDEKFEGNANFEYDSEGNMITGYIDDTNYKFTTKPLSELPKYGLTLEQVEADPTVERMSFTDKVLIVGSRPSVNNIEGYAYNATDAGNNSSSSARRKADGESGGITEEYDRSCMKNDNRFMHVTNVGTWNERKFDLSMKYTSVVYDANGDVTEVDGFAGGDANYTMVIPEPVLKRARVDVYCGSDRTTVGEESETDDFEYRGLSLTDARFHSMRDRIEIQFPNVSTYMQERMKVKMPFSVKLEKSADNAEVANTWQGVFSNNFEKDDDPHTDAVAVGPVLHPSKFHSEKEGYERKVTLIREEGYQYYPRWTDEAITSIDITDNAPINFQHEVKNAYLYYDDNGDLISRFTILVKHDPAYTPSPEADDHDAAERDKHNYVFHRGKDDLFEHLHHHSANDYYYVAIIDKDKVNPETTGDEDAIIDANGNVSDDNDKRLHAVVHPTDLLNGGEGKEFVITKNYGHYYDGQLEAVQKDHYSKHLQVLVSYLYPFADTSTSETPKQGMRRVVHDYTGSVLKSQANVQGFDGEVPTTVEGINGDASKVYAGVGFIEVEGIGAEIYSADGVKVAAGEGRHEVPAGVYVVTVSGRTTKVIVR